MTDGECLRALTNGDSISALKCSADDVIGSLKQPHASSMMKCMHIGCIHRGCEIQKKSKLMTDDHRD